MASSGSSRFSVLQSILIAGMLFSASQLNALTISCPSDASIVEKQAAKEVRRYIFLRTGTAPEIKNGGQVRQPTFRRCDCRCRERPRYHNRAEG